MIIIIEFYHSFIYCLNIYKYRNLDNNNKTYSLDQDYQSSRDYIR